MMMPSVSASSISSSAAGISSRFSRQTRCTSCAPRRRADSDTSTIPRGHGGLHSQPMAQVFDSADVLPTTSRAADRATSIATLPPPITMTLVADGEFVAEIHVKEKVDALVNAIQINAGMVRSRLRCAPTAISTASKPW